MARETAVGVRPEEIAPGVYRVEAGRGFTATNVPGAVRAGLGADRYRLAGDAVLTVNVNSVAAP